MWGEIGDGRDKLHRRDRCSLPPSLPLDGGSRATNSYSGGVEDEALSGRVMHNKQGIRSSAGGCIAGTDAMSEAALEQGAPIRKPVRVPVHLDLTMQSTRSDRGCDVMRNSLVAYITSIARGETLSSSTPVLAACMRVSFMTLPTSWR